MLSLTLIGRISQYIQAFGKLRNWYDRESILYVPIGSYKRKPYICRGRFTDNLKYMYDWFMIMSLECAGDGISRDFIVYKVKSLRLSELLF